MWGLVLIVVAIAAGGCTGSEPAAVGEISSTENRSFDGESAYEYALEQCEIGPRPPGTEAGWATGDYIITQLEVSGWQLDSQEFEYRGVKLRNIVGKLGQGPVVVLGAHYDTRPVADRDREHANQPIMGGNDGASGVAVLLELADVFAQEELEYEVWLAFFDGEDSGNLQGWPFCVGSSYMAEHLAVEPAYVIVVDMVGDTKQELYYEGNSDVALRERLWNIAAELGYEEFVPQVGRSIVDDHLPFVNAGIPAVDIIDIDYPYWHTVEDTCDKVSPQSLERVGRVLEEFLARGE
ncbi:MAG TPA: M28 family peptidase [Anaerolineae bacterium]|nr:M28 family peptidase [Anaerolineae bacterium]